MNLFVFGSLILCLFGASTVFGACPEINGKYRCTNALNVYDVTFLHTQINDVDNYTTIAGSEMDIYITDGLEHSLNAREGEKNLTYLAGCTPKNELRVTASGEFQKMDSEEYVRMTVHYNYSVLDENHMLMRVVNSSSGETALPVYHLCSKVPFQIN